MDIATFIAAVFQATATALTQDVTSWYAVNDKELFVARGIESRIVEYLRLNPDKDPIAIVLEPVDVYPGSDYKKVVASRILILKSFPESEIFNLRDDLTFNPILWPTYKEFMSQLVKYTNGETCIVESDSDSVYREESKVPGWQFVDPQNGFLYDAIEIKNLQFKIS